MGLEVILKEPITTGELLANLRSRLEPMQRKGQYIAEHMPELVRETVDKAALAYLGMLKLPGTGGVHEHVGNPPCWLERRHNDNEFLWQLNRMTHWQDMLEAYSITKEEQYGRKVLEEMQDWIDKVDIHDDMIHYSVDFFTGCHPLRALEIGIRSYKTWPLVLEHLGPTEMFTEQIVEKYVWAVYKQVKILRQVSPILWPNADHNHYLMECLGILTTALYFPELKDAEEWKAFAINGIERCAEAQLTEDGGQIEGCPSYHNGCMFWFGLAVVLAKRFGFSYSDRYMALFRTNLDYSIYSMRPTGKCVPVGDSHANYEAVMAGVYGYLALGDLSWTEMAANWIDNQWVKQEANKHIWRALDVEDFHRRFESVRRNRNECNKLKTTFWNRTLQQAIIRSGWDKEAFSLLFTCRSPVQNFHGHIDLMSFDFTAFGRTMVGDPGIFCYREDEDRRQFKSANYHSTLLVDERDHFEYRGSFGYGPQKPGEIYNVEDRGFYQVGSAYHLNYEPIVHHRHIALVDNRLVIVVDRVTGLSGESVQRYFHLDYTDVQLLQGYEAIIAKSDIANVALFTSPYEEADLLSGRMSDVNDVARPSTRVRFKGTHEGTTVFLTILVPYKGDQIPKVEVQPRDGESFIVTSGSDRYEVKVMERDLSILK
ncbi:heparinase II/III-like protein [Paenibacillus cellulosilyticus]|uniref:Heparinase II/III-like protein n=1 Tax=Paenibacillus cellulosilyticus TaxID=375489 RepID=A0A2V2YSV0_9BACL|nr:heparinase II/III family protein [Paenibacillus cellulosilyticus]PWW02388.1 heparinase II/III-like protein [Paenibacillus cellulosilyticus]QKS47101.1 alginate lyase family protein [Paenibacillus cellulosilyticus]